MLLLLRSLTGSGDRYTEFKNIGTKKLIFVELLSGAAVKLYLKKKRGSLTPKDARLACKNATALEVSSSMHNANMCLYTKV